MAAPPAASAKAPTPLAMPRPMSRNITAASRGSSTGVRKRTRLAAPAMPNARASESLMRTIIIAPDTHSRIWA